MGASCWWVHVIKKNSTVKYRNSNHTCNKWPCFMQLHTKSLSVCVSFIFPSIVFPRNPHFLNIYIERITDLLCVRVCSSIWPGDDVTTPPPFEVIITMTSEIMTKVGTVKHLFHPTHALSAVWLPPNVRNHFYTWLLKCENKMQWDIPNKPTKKMKINGL